MWPATSAVLRAPGIALPRYQKACCQTGSSAGPSGASIEFDDVIPTPSIEALIPSFGISRSSGTLTGPARRPSPFVVRAAGTNGCWCARGLVSEVACVVAALVGAARDDVCCGAVPPHAVDTAT